MRFPVLRRNGVTESFLVVRSSSFIFIAITIAIAMAIAVPQVEWAMPRRDAYLLALLCAEKDWLFANPMTPYDFDS
jgi:hypothetical protein